MPTKRQVPPGFLTSTQVAAMLGCSPCTLARHGVTTLAIKLSPRFHLYRESDVHRFCRKIGRTAEERAIPPGYELL